MTLVVDASVASKWIMPEDGSDRAAQLRVSGDDIIAPALIVSEVGNAIWKRVMWHEMPQADAVRALQIAVDLIERLEPLEALATRALELASELEHPIYDCFYLALAERERAALVTADMRLLRASKRLRSVEVRAL